MTPSPTESNLARTALASSREHAGEPNNVSSKASASVLSREDLPCSISSTETPRSCSGTALAQYIKDGLAQSTIDIF